MKTSNGTIQPLAGVYTFPNGISPKVNVVASQNFECNHFEAAFMVSCWFFLINSNYFFQKIFPGLVNKKSVWLNISSFL